MAGTSRTVLAGLEHGGNKAVLFRSVTFQGGMPELKQAILDRFLDVGGLESVETDHLIIHVKREDFGGEYEEVEHESEIPDKSVIKAMIEEEVLNSVCVCVCVCVCVSEVCALYTILSSASRHNNSILCSTCRYSELLHVDLPVYTATPQVAYLWYILCGRYD